MYFSTRPKSAQKRVTIVCFHPKGAKEATWLKALSTKLGFASDEPIQI